MLLIQLLYSRWNDFPFLYICVVLHCKKFSLYMCILYFLLQIQLYLSTYLVYLFKLHKRWSLPCKLVTFVYILFIWSCLVARPSFYYYALILSLVNAVQAVGSMLWYKGLKEQHIGQSGIWYRALIRALLLLVTTQHGHAYYNYLRDHLCANDLLDLLEKFFEVK